MTEYRYQQLEHWLLQGIQEQRWQLGERLPSIRTLCQEHQLSKATVQHALQRLEAQGLIEARPKAGFFITLPTASKQQPVSRSTIDAPKPVTVSELLQDIMRRGAAFDLKPDRLQGALTPGIQTLNRTVSRALRRQKDDAHQYYDEPAGEPSLREQLVRHYGRRGCLLARDQLAITSGCQNALFLALMATCEPGDVVAVESPGFYGVLQLLEQLKLQVIEIPTSAETGMDTKALEEVLNRWPVKACVVSPAFATPSGATLPQTAREHLLTLAERFDLAIIEDDIYADTAFGRAPDPLKALDEHERVILCGSLSKALSRDLRLGWIAGARWHRKILQLKLVTQLATSRYLQKGVADYMADGSYSTHLRRLRHQLRTQRDQLIARLQQWPVPPRFSIPQGGLTLWLELPSHADTLQMYTQALQQEIVITPGPLFSSSGQFRNCLRLSFAHPWNDSRLAALTQLSDYIPDTD